MAGSVAICFDERILSEYRHVLARSKFGFDTERVAVLLETIEATGQPVLAPPLNLSLPDPSDAPFVEVAVACDADFIVTGNLRHFPAESLRGVRAIAPRGFWDILAG